LLAIAWVATLFPARTEAQPDDDAALAQRARVQETQGLPMDAYRDRLEILRRHPDDTDQARLAALDLAAAGAPQAAAAFLELHPAAAAGEEGAAIARRIAGDLAARRVRWGGTSRCSIPRSGVTRPWRRSPLWRRCTGATRPMCGRRATSSWPIAWQTA
jgi:hypothetical protein